MLQLITNIYTCQLGNYHAFAIFLLKNLNIFSVEGLNLIDTYCNYKDENTQNVLFV